MNPAAIALAVLAWYAAKQPEPADLIMARVAPNQDRAQQTRSAFVYHQSMLIRFQRSNHKLAREEQREYVVTPTEQFEPEPYRFAEYAAYCRYIKTRFERLCDAPPDSVKTYPEPVPHCPICRWFAECDKKRRDDDHHG